MIESPTEFFKTLPPKQCCNCGKVIDEQAESYLNHCDHCLRNIQEYYHRLNYRYSLFC